jgi:hypothetical protein
VSCAAGALPPLFCADDAQPVAARSMPTRTSKRISTSACVAPVALRTSLLSSAKRRPNPRASPAVANLGLVARPRKPAAGNLGGSVDTRGGVRCLDALQLVADKNGLLREVARVLRPGGRAVITTWERNAGELRGLPPEYSIADAGALVEAAGLRLLVREECDDWLEQKRTFFQRVIGDDRDNAEPALRSLAEEGRSFLSHSASVRRLLLVATVSLGLAGGKAGGTPVRPTCVGLKCSGGAEGRQTPGGSGDCRSSDGPRGVHVATRRIARLQRKRDDRPRIGEVGGVHRHSGRRLPRRALESRRAIRVRVPANSDAVPVSGYDRTMATEADRIRIPV